MSASSEEWMWFPQDWKWGAHLMVCGHFSLISAGPSGQRWVFWHPDVRYCSLSLRDSTRSWKAHGLVCPFLALWAVFMNWRAVWSKGGETSFQNSTTWLRFIYRLAIVASICLCVCKLSFSKLTGETTFAIMNLRFVFKFFGAWWPESVRNLPSCMPSWKSISHPFILSCWSK
jgi:hypothetical protein